jgi:O-methyltransferase involved in polyketide biosynthesis
MQPLESGVNYYPKTATLYSAALEDGDFHTDKDSFATYLLSLFTPFPEKMKINRAFGKAMFEEYGREKFANILDIGAGPMPRAHEWAPGARILYVDHNPAIVEHARKKLRPEDNSLYETSSVHDLKGLFMKGLGERAFGNDRKLAIGSNAVLMFVSDEDIREAFTYLYNWVDRGSVLTISMTGITASESHFRAKMIGRFFRWLDAPMHIRNINSFASLLAPWTMVKGPMPAWQWLGWPPSKSTAGIGFDLYGMRLIKK